MVRRWGWGVGGLRHGRVKALLIVVIQQHRDDCGLVFTLGQAAANCDEPLASLDVHLVARPKLGFEEGRHTLRNDLLDVRTVTDEQLHDLARAVLYALEGDDFDDEG